MGDRSAGVGASDMAAVLGANGTYRSAFEVWQAKTGRLEDDESSKPLDLFGVGNMFEPALFEHGRRLALELGSGEDPPGHEPGFLRHDNGVVQGHPDYRAGSAIIEAKVVVHGRAPRGKLQWEMQARTYMALTGCDMALVVMLDLPERLPAETLGLLWRTNGDGPAMLDALASVKWAQLSHVTYRRDLAVEEAMLARAVDWWERYVVADVPPPVDGSAASAAHLVAQHPPQAKDERTVREAEELRHLADAYTEAREAEKEAKARKAKVSQMLMESIGDDYGVKGSGWTATWARFDRATTDWKRLRAERPDVADVIDEYTESKPTGRLTVRVREKG